MHGANGGVDRPKGSARPICFSQKGKDAKPRRALTRTALTNRSSGSPLHSDYALRVGACVTWTPLNSAVISKKMKTLSIRTILVGLLLALGSFYLIIFIHTLLDFVTQIKLKKPLNSYLLWGYSPMIVSGIYIGFSKVREKVLNGVLAGALFYFILWLISDVLIPAPHFDHSFKPLSFGLGLVRNGFTCAIVAWLTYTVLKRRRPEVK